jgi:aldehyde:ferredoxin oxidoreductase
MGLNIYEGQILHVNLTTKEIKVKSLNWDFVEKFIGGWGINFIYYGFESVAHGVKRDLHSEI